MGSIVSFKDFRRGRLKGPRAFRSAMTGVSIRYATRQAKGFTVVMKPSIPPQL